PFEYIFNEDNSLIFNTISLNDDPSAIVTVTLTVSNGTLTLDTNAIPNLTFTTGDGTNDTAVEFSGTLADVNDALSGLTFTPNTHFNGNETLSISISSSVSDGINPPIVTADSQNISLAITAVNDDPVLTPISLTVAEGGQVTFIASTVNGDGQLGLVDPDIATGQQVVEQQIVKITQIPTKGTLRLGTQILQVGSVFSYDQLGNVTYTHDGSDVSPGDTDSFAVTVNDGGGGQSDSDPVTPGSQPTIVTINLNPVNIVPTISVPDFAIYEGTIGNNIGSLLSVDLGDIFDTNNANGDGNNESTFTIISVNNNGQGTLFFNGSPVSAGQTFDVADLNLLTFDHNGSEPSVFPSFVIQVTDAGGGTGSPLTSSNITVKIGVNEVNDDPQLIENNPIDVTGGSTTILTSADLSVTDIDSPDGQLVYSLQTRPEQGILELNVGDSTNPDWKVLGAGGFFTQEELTDGKVRYTHQLDGTTVITDTFTFKVRDSDFTIIPNVVEREGGVRDNPTDTSLAIKTFTINITSPNPTPTPNISGPSPGYGGENPNPGDPIPGPIIDPSVTYTNNNFTNIADGDRTQEGGAGILTDDMLNFVFVNNAVVQVPPEQTVYTLLDTPSNGILQQWNGTAWVNITVGSNFTQADINKGDLNTTPGLGDVGVIRFLHDNTEDFISTFNYTVSVGGEIRVNTKDDPAYDPFTLDIVPINDNPTISEGKRIVLQEGGNKTIFPAEVVLADVDGNGSDKPVDLFNLQFGDQFAIPNTLEFQVTKLPQFGKLQIDGIDVVIGQWYDESYLRSGNPNSNKFVYIHDGTENFLDTFQVQGRDNHGALSELTDIGIDIFPVNDTPIVPLTTGAPDITIPDPLTVNGVTEIATATNKGLGFVTPLNEGDTGVITNNLLQAVDPDNNRIQRQYRITDKVDYGTLLLNGKALG
ncbi:MAG: hypothetical protein D6822_02525, partial [Cyanobacteria bacterium J149]